MRKFVELNFKATHVGHMWVRSGDDGNSCMLWKHTINPSKELTQLELQDGRALKIIVVKDPLFWYLSLKKHMYGLQGDLLGELMLPGSPVRFNGVAGLWCSYLKFYLEHELFHEDTVMIRSSDLVHHQDELYKTLNQLLESRENMHINDQRSKSEGRNYYEARKFYTGDQLSKLRELNPDFELALLREIPDFQRYFPRLRS